MSSSEANKKSSFSVTCSLLSQYLKSRNGSFGDLGVLDIAPKPQETPQASYRTPTTLNLLAGLEAPAETETDAKNAVSVSDRNGTEEVINNDTKKPENAPLTIFYGRKVLVFEDFSPEKAADLMNLATMGSSSAPRPVVNPNATAMPMPLARRASLHRFLEKRKDRISSKAPYQIEGSKPQEAAKSWLGLGQDI